MEKQMNRRPKSRLLLVVLLVVMLALVAVLAVFWVTVLQSPFHGLQTRRPPSGLIPGDFEFFYAAFAVTSTLNIALLVILIAIYTDIYIKTRSPFTVGLLIFGVAFLVKDFTSNPLVISLLGYRAYGLGPFELLPGIFEFFALSVLLYLSIRY